MKPKVVVILGPTATGKSNCGIELAKQLNGEIISGDSMLVYKRMDIGTAKPTAEELSEVKHYMVDILEPEESFNVADFQRYADELIRDINARGKLPIIVGGTGLYIKALLENYHFNTSGGDESVREELEQLLSEQGKEALYAKLRELDPVSAENIDPENTRRVIRAIEVALSGENISKEKDEEFPYDAVVFGLTMPRDFLYERINKRVDIMLEEGLFEEVEGLLRDGVSPEAQSMQAIGYRQVVLCLNGGWPKDYAIDKLKQATRNFAKRQVTWYKKMPYIKWYELTPELEYKKIIEDMRKTVVEKFKLS